MSEPYFIHLELLAFSCFHSKLSITVQFRKIVSYCFSVSKMDLCVVLALQLHDKKLQLNGTRNKKKFDTQQELLLSILF